MLERRDRYEDLYRDFRWTIPERFNIGTAVADGWAARAPDRPALFDYDPSGPARTLSFGALAAQSNALANALRKLGVRRGDRVALLLPQCFETVISHVAIYKLGAIAVPLALLFGVEALEYRLQTAGVKAIITNAAGHAKLKRIGDRLPDLRHVVVVEGTDGDGLGFRRLVADHSKHFQAEDTGPDDPAMMIFTSGTTGPPKGALHGHRVLLGHLPGVQMAYEFLPGQGDLMWTPADWAWAGGLLNALLPSLYFGVPVVASRFEKFDPESALLLAERMKVRTAFIPPTALRMMKGVSGIGARFSLDLRAVCSAGEALGRETFDWARTELGLTVNEFYGQTECNLVLGSCGAIGISRAGAIGLPVPGHRVAVIDGEGRRVKTGTPGQIAIARPDPVMFLEYWRNEEATAKKFVGDWMTTGDQGIEDEDGYVHFFGRDDDVITSAGFRIGPGEIEDCLTGHPAVALAAAVGKPDTLRTEIVKAYVVLKDGFAASPELAEEIRLWVRERLSAHEYPREVEFVDSMPLTTTGKVIRRIFRDRAKREAAV
ncbi:acetyl-CoA synthetase [Mesorhizobium sp. L-8-10]|uniref:AMP-binding protein n=1 Tax=unclassified Mesorhizobium TaxID=325217 RepID=UPI0019255E5A|nr:MULTISPECIES: AMP-binding protein [unclassified Mesorhizobium]BCH22729.1 acetyl-CoA synthetase [Mesorhizobium sp. L-8-3]BCH30533.1 acetyl-CoA synthetase [Mesorhizobium sp. L-8-10]